MANVNSDIISAESSGDNLIPQHAAQAAKTTLARCTLSAALSANDTVTVCRVPVDARIPSIRIWSTDLGTTGTLDVGFHRIQDDGTIGSAVDADAIGTAIDVNAAAINDVEIRYETKAISTANQAVWELAGLSARPSYGEVFLTITAATATTAAGTVVVKLETI